MGHAVETDLAWGWGHRVRTCRCQPGCPHLRVLLCGAGRGLGLLQRLSVRRPQVTLLRPMAQGHSGLWGGGCCEDGHRDREGLVAGSWAPGLGGTWESRPCPQPGISIWCLVEKLLVAQEVGALSGALPHLGGRGCQSCSSRGGAGAWQGRSGPGG